MCTSTRSIRGRLSINTLDRHLINTQLTLQQVINISVDTWWILNWHFSQQWVRSWLLVILDWCIWVGQHSTDYSLVVDQVLIECLSSVDWGRVLIQSIDWHLTTHDLTAQENMDQGTHLESKAPTTIQLENGVQSTTYYYNYHYTYYCYLHRSMRGR